MNQIELNDILEKHRKWLRDEEGGERVDLSYANLRGVDLRDANLRGADLRGADLRDANLRGANLRGVDLRDANLRDANLRGANLSYADLSYANLRYADLRDANLRGVYLRDANLRGANLSYADLSYANLRGANLRGVYLRDANLSYASLRGVDLSNIKTNYMTIGIALSCPEEGSFIAYKKADGKLIKLEIPEDAKRSSATTRKCRCSKAKVLEIEGGLQEISSDWDDTFIYKVGEIVEVKDFEEDRWEECSTGIHFFISKDDAISYQS